jgi:crotonobetaine/carnitine-CoA ligase
VVAERLAPLVSRGARVATCLRPGGVAVGLLFGLARLGAVEVPLALDLPVPAARELLRVTGASVLLVGSTVLADGRLAGLVPDVDTVLVVDDGGGPGARRVRPLAELPRRAVRRAAPEPGSPLAIMSTSGTTGRPKAAMLPHFAAVRQARRVAATLGYGPDDVLFNVFPWNHINVRHAALLPALLSGGRLVAHRRFSASAFWEVCRAEGVTAFNFMGAMLAILERRPPRSDDRDHRVRLAYGAPAPRDLASSFLGRFGVRALEAYACTELGDVALNTVETWRPGTAGRVVPEYEVAILDEEGRPLPPGEVGQIAARPRLDHMSFLGYVGDPASTAAVTEGGWFRTGDRGRLDAAGYLTFAGRRSDVVRRRGESVAAWEVEQVVRQLPDVIDAAVVGVDSDLTEQEILVAAVVSPGSPLDGAAIRSWCTHHLPRHAVPRYVRVLPDLPRTPSGKVVKRVLVEAGVDVDTFDAEQGPPRSTSAT